MRQKALKEAGQGWLFGVKTDMPVNFIKNASNRGHFFLVKALIGRNHDYLCAPVLCRSYWKK